MVIDRIFLIFYMCGIFIGNVAIIFEAPLATNFFKELFCCYEDWAVNGESSNISQQIVIE